MTLDNILDKYFKSNKTYPKQRIREVLKEVGIYDKSIVVCGRNVPIELKVGDIFFYGELSHPVLILVLEGNRAKCVVLTSNQKCSEMLGEVHTRYLQSDYFTSTLTFVDIANRQTKYIRSVSKVELMRIKNVLSTVNFNFRRNIKYEQ